MSAAELRRLMARLHLSSGALGKLLGRNAVSVRRWRSGARAIGDGDADAIRAIARERGARLEIEGIVNPREIAPFARAVISDCDNRGG